jgi:methionyl-tRNA formyltransferase
MKILLVGAVESTEVALEMLRSAGTPPSALITLPPTMLSRHSDAVDLTERARGAGIPVFHSTNVNSAETLEAVRSLQPDVTMVIGWSQVCKAPFRELSGLGCIGFHPSALPALRGRAVIPWTILTRQTETGSTFFWLDDGVDTGDILLQRRVPVSSEETARSLYDKHLAAVRDMLPEVIRQLATGSPARMKQSEQEASYCARRTWEDGLINWRDTAENVLVLIRAVGDPYPGAFTFSEGARLLAKCARRFPEGERFIGLTGQVQLLTEEGFVVRCGDGACVEVLDWDWKFDRKPGRHSILGEC